MQPALDITFGDKMMKPRFELARFDGCANVIIHSEILLLVETFAS